MSDPHEVDAHTAVGAYVADALDDQERRTFERHLQGCASCRQEVAELTETAAELTWLTQAPPPPALRASILSEIATVRPLPPTGEETTQPMLPDELAGRRRRRVSRVLIGLVAAALVAVVALGGWASTLVGQHRSQQVASQQIHDLLAAPDAKIYPTTLNGANVSYVVSEQRNQAVFVGAGVASPGAGRVYQLWTVRGADATSQGLVTDGGAVTHWFDASLDGAQVLAVTVEPAGGSAAPTTTPLAAVEL